MADKRGPGELAVIGTPIGNLGDLSPRAQDVLASRDVLVCEDTRRSGVLLKHFGITVERLLIANDHNEASIATTVVELLNEGKRVGIVSDAGMPVISDPGFRMISAAIRAGYDPVVIPGPSAVSSAIALSGIEAHRYVFEGFLPRKGEKRSERLLELGDERRAIVIYESPNRLQRTLVDLAEFMGTDRDLAVARELTKLHEEVWRGTLGDAATYFADGTKGEVVLVVAGKPNEAESSDAQVLDALQAALDAGQTKRDAVTAVSATHRLPKRVVYDLIHQLDR